MISVQTVEAGTTLTNLDLGSAANSAAGLSSMPEKPKKKPTKKSSHASQEREELQKVRDAAERSMDLQDFRLRMSRKRDVKVLYRVEVAGHFTIVDSPIDLSMLVNRLVGGYGERPVKGLIKPEDIHVTLHSAPPDPADDEPVWKKIG